MLEGHFTENLGQFQNDDVRYFARGENLCLGLTPDGAMLLLDDVAGGSGDAGAPVPRGAPLLVTIDIEGCNLIEPVGIGPLGHTNNFFLGNDPSRWVQGARSFKEVLYEDIYDGIDLRFYFREGVLKYDFIVEAGADPGPATLRYSGIEGLSVDESTGDLLVRTQAGTLRDARPVILQQGTLPDEGAVGWFLLRGEGRVSFVLPEDCDDRRPMVIDPGIEYCTLLGGEEEDYVSYMDFDISGNMYIGGGTKSIEFPDTTPGAFDGIGNATPYTYDLFIVKLDPTGSTLLAATYIGGTGNDVMTILRLVDDGFYLFGGTNSTDLPMLPGSPQDAFAGGPADGFILNMDLDCSRLLHSTYLGGSGDELIFKAALNDEGSLYVTMSTTSPNLPCPSESYCGTYEGPGFALYIARLSKDLSSIRNGAYINFICECLVPETPYHGMAIDALSNVYVTGTTLDYRFPTTPGAYDTREPVNRQAFVMKLDPNLSRIIASTFLGGGWHEQGMGIGVCSGDRVVVTGVTASTDFPTTTDALCRTYKDHGDGFLTVFDGNLTSLSYSTFIPGSAQDVPLNLVTVKGSDRCFLMISSYSRDLPTTLGCYDDLSGHERFTHIYLAEFNLEAPELVYGTYLGDFGTAGITVTSPAIVTHGLVAIFGYTNTAPSVVTEGAYQTSYVGGVDGILCLLDPTPCGTPAAPTDLFANASDSLVMLNWTAPPYDGSLFQYYKVYRSDSSGNIGQKVGNVSEGRTFFNDTQVQNGRHFFYHVRAVNSAGEGNLSEEIHAYPLGVPTIPRDLIAKTGDGSVNLTWRASERDGGEPLRYRVLRESEGQVPSVVYDTSELVFLDENDNVTVGVRYIYTVQAYNSRYNITNITEVIALGPPSVFNVTEGDGNATLRWGFPEGVGPNITGYKIYRGRSSASIPPYEWVGPAQTEYFDEGLENGRPYYYYITTVCSSVESLPSQTWTIVPYGKPFPPQQPIAEGHDEEVILTWIKPNDNGREILYYTIYSGVSESELSQVGNTTSVSYAHTGLRNGQTYYYRVTATNLAGESVRSERAWTVPKGPPKGAPSNITFNSTKDGTLIRWDPLLDWGGGTERTYIVFRGKVGEDPEELDRVTGKPEYTDPTADVGVQFTYQLQAENEVGKGPRSEPGTYARKGLPGQVQGLNTTGTHVRIDLNWTPPKIDGGASIIGYIINRGRAISSIQELVRLGNVTTYSDLNVIDNVTYFYTVQALNEIGAGPETDIVEGIPGPPIANVTVVLGFSVEGDAVRLTWIVTTAPGVVPPTNFTIMRGKTTGAMVEFVVLGDVTTYMDQDVPAGPLVHYCVVALGVTGHLATSNVVDVPIPIEEPPPDNPIVFAWVFLLVLFIVLVVGRHLWRTRGRTEDLTLTKETDIIAEVTAPSGSTARAMTASPPTGPTHVVEEVLIVFRDGRLIADCTREGCRTQDADIISGMLVAIKGIMQEGLRRGSMESIKYGDSQILMAAGRHVNLAAVVYGEPPMELHEQLERTITSIESTYAGVIEKWVGDLSVFAGIEELARPILDSTRGVSRDDIKKSVGERGTTLLSSVDFHHGYVRLKVAAVNPTDETLVDASVAINYNEDMLRLERVEPATLERKGNRVILGNIRPGERETIAFLFDPQICQGTYLDGGLSYYDSKGELHRVEMKRRTADVVCPIFFTREHANTAMLRRLVKDELRSSDLRLFRYPEGLDATQMLELGKLAMSIGGVQLVREYVERGPPLYAEVWYYGETKVKGYRMVMRLGLIEEEGVLEFFAATTTMEPITGMLAEFRRELERVMRERHPGDLKLVVERDDGMRRGMADRGLRIDKDGSAG